MHTTDASYIQWLLDHAMLEQGKPIAARYSAQGHMWQHPYAEPQPRAAAELASVWFAAYPPSIVTRPGDSVLQTLGNPKLWEAFAEIGISGVHTGPMKQAGGLSGRTFTPTIDGYFDRISLDIDPTFGTTAEFMTMSENAIKNGAVVIDDIIPGHTGKGADFRLAELGHGDYPGIYHMVDIAPVDWALLPDVPDGRDSINLDADVVDTLKSKGYIVGQLSRTIFYAPGIKETDWSATPVIKGADGVERRWVYLHYFKEGQPTLNWLDPTFAGPRMVIGDALHSLGVLGARMLRLDANGFLGIEKRDEGRAWSEGHPLSITANQVIAGMVRKAGGFTFQELNLTVDDIAAMSKGGPDLAYDFITRPAYHHAIVTGNTEFLRLMLAIMHANGIDPAALVHALQNHDEMTLELVHFWTLHKDDRFELAGRDWSGAALREHIRTTMYERTSGPNAPYNLRFTTNGVASTTASIVAAALGIRDIRHLSHAEKAHIQQGHLLLAMYNAFQPGVFAISGWDLVGALTLPHEKVAHLMEDGDTRWIHRGAYDLMNVNPTAETSLAGLPLAPALYGSVPEQLANPDSFLRQLQRMLKVRQQYRLYAARQIQIPQVENPALLVMVHALPDHAGTQVTALNFGVTPLAESISLDGIKPGRAIDMFTGDAVPMDANSGTLHLQLAGHEGRSILIPS